MREIADILDFDSRDGFEIEDVIERVRQLANKASPGEP